MNQITKPAAYCRWRKTGAEYVRDQKKKPPLGATASEPLTQQGAAKRPKPLIASADETQEPLVEITVFTKSDGPLSKRISLNKDGKVNSDGSACKMWGAAPSAGHSLISTNSRQ